MALHLTPEEHNADPPSGWSVRKSGRKWHLCNKDGAVLDSFDTKFRAEVEKSCGLAFRMYQTEGRWFNGQDPPGWKSYAVCVAERQRNAYRAALASGELRHD